MAIKFISKEKRDELARRLADLAMHMERSGDQGSHNQIFVHGQMIDDIRTAAAVIHLADVQDDAIPGQIQDK